MKVTIIRKKTEQMLHFFDVVAVDVDTEFDPKLRLVFKDGSMSKFDLSVISGFDVEGKGETE